MENTHPFAHDRWLLAHNGTVPAFERIRPHLLGFIDPEFHKAIQGDTDSEHLFYLFLFLKARHPEESLVDILRRGVHQIINWLNHVVPERVSLTANIILTNGEESVGLRFGRPLWFVERHTVHPCEVCDCEHVTAPPLGSYRAVVVASEPVTKTEEWMPIPDGMLFYVGPDIAIRFESL